MPEFIEASDSSVRQPAASGVGYRTYQQPSYFQQIIELEASAKRLRRNGEAGRASLLKWQAQGLRETLSSRNLPTP